MRAVIVTTVLLLAGCRAAPRPTVVAEEEEEEEEDDGDEVGPVCDDAENLCLEPGTVFVASGPLESGWVGVAPATPTGDGFVELETGDPLGGEHVWRPRRPAAGEPRIGQHVIAFDKSGDNGIYECPLDEQEARRSTWWLAQVTGVDAAAGVVHTSGGDRVHARWLFVAEASVAVPD